MKEGDGVDKQKWMEGIKWMHGRRLERRVYIYRGGVQ